MSADAMTLAPATSTKGLRIRLWTAQIILAALFIMAGGSKIVTPGDQLMAMMKDAPIPLGLARFIGVAEAAGGIGMILPALTRIMPILTPVAAVGLVVVMVLACGFNLMHGQLGAAVATVVLGLLAAYVAYGRFTKGAILPR